MYAHNNIYIIIIFYNDFNDLNYYYRLRFLSTLSHSHCFREVILDSGHFCILKLNNSR